jgi:hypothetical protein
MPLDHPHFRHLVCFNFHVGWRHIQAIYRQAFPNGVNPQRAYLLCACDPDRPTPVASPLDALELDSLAMSGLLARLQAQGLLPREVDPDDRREILVHLTPEGVELPPGHRRAGQGGRPAPGPSTSTQTISTGFAGCAAGCRPGCRPTRPRCRGRPG